MASYARFFDKLYLSVEPVRLPLKRQVLSAILASGFLLTPVVVDTGFISSRAWAACTTVGEVTTCTGTLAVAPTIPTDTTSLVFDSSSTGNWTGRLALLKETSGFSLQQLAGSSLTSTTGVIDISHTKPGDLEAQLSGAISGAVNHAVYLHHGDVSGDVRFTLDGGSVTGANGGVWLSLSGNSGNFALVQGNIDAEIRGDITGNSETGLRAEQQSSTGTVTVRTISGNISGLDGVRATHLGIGNVAVYNTANVSGTNRGIAGIIGNDARGNILIEHTGGSVTGRTYGIYAFNNPGAGKVSGTSTINVSADVTASGNGSSTAVGIDQIGLSGDATVNHTAGTLRGVFGIYVGNDGVGATQVTSGGQIVASGTGIYLNTGATATTTRVDHSGTISGGSTGIRVLHSGTGAAEITTSGNSSISASTDGIWLTNSSTGAGRIRLEGDTRINSQGDGVSITTSGAPSADQSIVLVGNARITATTHGIFMQNARGGTVDLGANTSVSGSQSIRLQDGATSGYTVRSAGSLSGDVYLSGGADTITISGGTVSGSVYAGAGNDTITISGGTVSGSAHAGAGDDTINLSGGTMTGSLLGDDGNDTINWTGGRLLSAGIFGQAGSDTLNVSSSFYDGTQYLDGDSGGAAAVIADDRLNLTGISATSDANYIINWERVTLSRSSLELRNGTFASGALGNANQGVFLKDSSRLIASTALTVNANMNIESGSRFETAGEGVGVYSVLGTLANAGTVSLQTGKAGDRLTLNNYRGEGGTLALDSALGLDNSLTDRVTISGALTGQSKVHVRNSGGAGGITVNGLRLINVTGTSPSNALTLSGDYALKGVPVVVGGAYAYSLHQGAVDGSDAASWFLRSTLIEAVTPQPTPAPRFAATVPVYETLGHSLQALSQFDSLERRIGNRTWGELPGRDTSSGFSELEHIGFWLRGSGSFEHSSTRGTTTGVSADQSIGRFEGGLDAQLWSNEHGVAVGGLSLIHMRGSTSTRSPYDHDGGAGGIATSGTGLGATLTWYADNGFYLDAQGHVLWFDSDLSIGGGSMGIASGVKGQAYGASLEVGQRLQVAPDWIITPQAQLSYVHSAFSGFTDRFGARVDGVAADNLRARLGVSAEHSSSHTNAKGTTDTVKLYGAVNVTYDFGGDTSVTVSGVPFAQERSRLRGGVALGVDYSFDDGAYSIFGQVSADTGLSNFGDDYGLGVRVGLRGKF